MNTREIAAKYNVSLGQAAELVRRLGEQNALTVLEAGSRQKAQKSESVQIGYKVSRQSNLFEQLTGYAPDAPAPAPRRQKSRELTTGQKIALAFGFPPENLS